MITPAGVDPLDVGCWARSRSPRRSTYDKIGDFASAVLLSIFDFVDPGARPPFLPFQIWVDRAAPSAPHLGEDDIPGRLLRQKSES